ncbi:MAG: carbon storage regulator CsrA [Verrucomicrobiales bacterium]|nr:carbon storage regulator CsrA [Verrucomicrobiales bacterium]
MLILCRKINESVVIDGMITVKVLRIDGDQVRLGIQAPSDVPVHRHEVYEEIQRNNREAATHVRPDLPRLASPNRPLSTPPAASSAKPKTSTTEPPTSNLAAPATPARAAVPEAAAPCVT